MLTGLKKDTQYRYIQQFVVYNTEGKQTASKIFKDAEKQTSSTLSLTNIRGEFVHIVNRFFGIYITMYDENLKVTRNVDNQLLDGFEDFYGFHNPVVSVGKNLMYIAINLEDYDGYFYKRIYVLDLSEKQALKLIQIYTYYDYPDSYLFAHSIQAFKDGSAILHYYNTNQYSQSILIQIRYDQNGKFLILYLLTIHKFIKNLTKIFNQKGDQMLSCPKEINIPLNIFNKFQVNWPWYTYLHENGKTATFLGSDQYNLLMIYTFNQQGETICSKIIDIYDYVSYQFYYGIIGNQGWIYLLGNFGEPYLGIFDPNKCILNNIRPFNTNIYEGLVGSLIDGKNKQVLIYQFGNISDLEQLDDMEQVGTIQDTYYAMIYKIGTFEGEEDNFFLDFEGEEEGENIGFIQLD